MTEKNEGVKYIIPLCDGEGEPGDDFDAYQDDVDAAESEADRLREELELIAQLCQEAAIALREEDRADSRADLIKKLEAQ